MKQNFLPNLVSFQSNQIRHTMLCALSTLLPAFQGSVSACGSERLALTYRGSPRRWSFVPAVRGTVRRYTISALMGVEAQGKPAPRFANTHCWTLPSRSRKMMAQISDVVDRKPGSQCNTKRVEARCRPEKEDWRTRSESGTTSRRKGTPVCAVRRVCRQPRCCTSELNQGSGSVAHVCRCARYRHCG